MLHRSSGKSGRRGSPHFPVFAGMPSESCLSKSNLLFFISSLLEQSRRVRKSPVQLPRGRRHGQLVPPRILPLVLNAGHVASRTSAKTPPRGRSVQFLPSPKVPSALVDHTVARAALMDHSVMGDGPVPSARSLGAIASTRMLGHLAILRSKRGGFLLPLSGLRIMH